MSDRYPVIIIPGIGQSKVEQLDSSGNRIRIAWPMDVDLKDYLGELAGPFMKLVFFKKHKELADKLSSLVPRLLDPIAVNPDGTMKNRLRAVEFPSLAKCSEDEKRYVYKMVPLQKLSAAIGEENLYFFSYNSFDLPYNTAEKLDAFVDNVLKETGSEKVNFIAVSLGGAMLNAYLDAYGDKGLIHRIVNVVSATQGTRLVSDILNDRIDTSRIMETISLFADDNFAETADKYFSKLSDEALRDISAGCMSSFRSTLAANSGSVWATVPPEEYESTANKLIKNAELRAQTDRYHAAQSDLASLYRRQTEGFGVKVFNLLGYGLELLPFAASHDVSSDGIVTARSASLGADVRPLPDGTPDVSTGLFPRSTWYFRGVDHEGMARSEKALDIICRAMSDESFIDIDSDPDLPQMNG